MTQRERLEAIIEAAIALLDLIDGDADLEAAGDELDQSFTEDGQVCLGFELEDDEDGGDREGQNHPERHVPITRRIRGVHHAA